MFINVYVVISSQSNNAHKALTKYNKKFVKYFIVIILMKKLEYVNWPKYYLIFTFLKPMALDSLAKISE